MSVTQTTTTTPDPTEDAPMGTCTACGVYGSYQLPGGSSYCCCAPVVEHQAAEAAAVAAAELEAAMVAESQAWEAARGAAEAVMAEGWCRFPECIHHLKPLRLVPELPEAAPEAPSLSSTASKAELMAANLGDTLTAANGSVWTKTSVTHTSSSRWTDEGGSWHTSNQLASRLAWWAQGAPAFGEAGDYSGAALLRQLQASK